MDAEIRQRMGSDAVVLNQQVLAMATGDDDVGLKQEKEEKRIREVGASTRALSTRSSDYLTKTKSEYVCLTATVIIIIVRCWAKHCPNVHHCERGRDNIYHYYHRSYNNIPRILYPTLEISRIQGLPETSL